MYDISLWLGDCCRLCDRPVGRKPDGLASLKADPSVEGVGLLSCVSDGGSDNSLKGLLSDFILVALAGSPASTSADSSSSAGATVSGALPSSSCDDASPSSALPFELPRLGLVDEDCSG